MTKQDPRAILERLREARSRASEDLVEIVPASVRGLLDESDCECIRESLAAVPALVEALEQVLDDCEKAIQMADVSRHCASLALQAGATQTIIRDALAPLGEDNNG